MNSPIATINCAITKEDSKFVVDAISTDGGSIPRNVIIQSGLKLVKYGALSYLDFVRKTSYNPSQMFGLKNKGHLSVGTDADITIIDPIADKSYGTIVGGDVVMLNDFLIKKPGKLLSTIKGEEFLKGNSVNYEIIDLEDGLFFKGKSIG